MSVDQNDKTTEQSEALADFVRRVAEIGASPNRPASGGETTFWQDALFAALWGGLALTAGAVAWMLYTGAAGAAGLSLAAVTGLLAIVFLAAAIRPAPAALLAEAALRRAVGADGKTPMKLAGAENLGSLSIAESVLDADPDARLVTRRNGAVVFANAAYFAIARDAGVIGQAGLPPRVERLFSQQGSEASKLFRLCRAANSGHVAEEVIHQQIGLSGGGVRRRFEVSVRRVDPEGEFSAWRLRELAEDEERDDPLAAAFADFPRPVFAIERSGQIAWTNASMRAALGRDRSELRTLDDFVLGEVRAVADALSNSGSAKAIVRTQSGEGAEATFRAFGKGGVGEGFLCVEADIETRATEPETPALAGDFSDAPFGVAVIEGEIGRDARIIDVNRAFSESFGGVSRAAPLSKALPADAIEEIAAEIRRKSAAGGSPRMIDVAVGDGQDARHIGVYARPVRRRRGAYGTRRTFIFTVDITDRKRMEQDHAQDQKLKAIGFIAGEVAHDFNNLLQVIQGNCEQLMLRHPVGDPAYQDLVLIRENAQRAANLTKQLLAYSRKQTLTRKVQSVTDILLDFARFLDRAVGEKVKLELSNGRGVPPVKIDRNQFETAIMNLAVNARDAMAPAGGKLTIRTRFVSAAELEGAPVPGFGANDCVLIEVIDTGPGVPPEIVDKIFDPFFTTKEEGKGTGLGLSTVHGVIGQMGGAITVGAGEDGGAAFRIYLPAHAQTQEVEEEPAREEAPPAGADYSGVGRILVVEDEDPVRTLVVKMLERSGYEVVAAEDGVAALEILEEDRAFDLIVTDVMMPEVDGPTFVQRARAELAIGASVIFMSGYAETAMREQMDTLDNVGYIQKPFAMAELGQKVKSALFARSGAAAAA